MPYTVKIPEPYLQILKVDVLQMAQKQNQHLSFVLHINCKSVCFYSHKETLIIRH